MKIVFFDHAQQYRTAEKEAFPQKRNGKFVQVRHDKAEYLIFASREAAPYHADIIERFCKERGIPGVYNASRKSFVIHDPAWIVVGGGKFEIDASDRRIRLYDNSMAYGKFDPKGLEGKIHAAKELADYMVKIE